LIELDLEKMTRAVVYNTSERQPKEKGSFKFFKLWKDNQVLIRYKEGLRLMRRNPKDDRFTIELAYV